MNRMLSRDEMIELVSRIVQIEGSEDEIDEYIERFLDNCIHPSGTDLIFWPSEFPYDPSVPEPTVEQIVDLAMRGCAE